MGMVAAGILLLRELWGFLRDSTPSRRRQRYGDMEYDWERRVDTTSGTVGWRARLLGVFHSPYQPTDPALFRQMMAELPIAFPEFTFIDIGSGKGRTLLMASEYPFKKIVGVELIAELHRVAEENVARYREETKAAEPARSPIETLRLDARDFAFPETPLVLYLFNPLPEPGLRQVIRNLEGSLVTLPRPVWIVYHNPLLEPVLAESPYFARELGTPEYSVFRTIAGTDSSPFHQTRFHSE
jgi:SAM-dependent methyltransferase